MNRIFTFLLTAAGVLSLAGCELAGKGDAAGPIRPNDPSDLNTEFYADQTMGSIGFTAEAGWTASVAAKTKAEDIDWIDVNPKNGGAGPNTLEVTLQPNQSGTDREAEIRILCEGHTTVFVVRQVTTEDPNEAIQYQGVYFQADGGEWVSSLNDLPRDARTLVIETRTGTAVIPEDLMRRIFTDYSPTHLDMSGAQYAYTSFPCVVDENGSSPNTLPVPSSLESIVLPRNVVTLSEAAFRESGLVSIDLSQIDTLGRQAFRGSTRLVSVNLSPSLAVVGEEAFSECSALEEVTIPASVDSIGNYAFIYSGLQSVTVEASPSSTPLKIGEGAFKECEFLRTLNFGGREILIGKNAFYKCMDLREVTLPRVTYIGEGAFQACQLLSSVVANDVLTMGSQAFYGCVALKTVELNDSLKVIPAGAFGFCEVMSQIRLPEGLVEIGDYAFSRCAQLSSITLPQSLEVLGSGPFSGTGIEYVTLPENVRELGTGTFSGCKKLKHVEFLTEKITRIPDSFMDGITTCHSVSLPESVEEIGAKAFQSCEELNMVSLGSRVTKIGERAFLNCWRITSFYCDAVNPPQCPNPEVFQNAGLNQDPAKTLYVPAGSEAAYRADPNWSELLRRLDIVGK